jgi:hypothetical protein
MDQERFDAQAERLIKSQDNLIGLMKMQANATQGLIDYVASLRHYLDGYRVMFGETGKVLESTLETLRENLSIVKELGESLELIKKAVTENYTATNDNNERLALLLTQVEAYFGTTGLDYDN